MGRISSVLALVLIVCGASASAGDFPARKAGLWQIVIAGAHSIKVRQCSNAASDEAMAEAGIGLPGDCAKHDVQHSGDTITIDSVCRSSSGKPTTSHIVITGSLDSKYTMTMSSQERKKALTLSAEWLGPCGAGQKPGDVIMPDGVKINLLSAEKGAPARR